MRFLLDTHTFLWFIAGDSQLSRQARLLIEDEANTLALSIGSLWEIAIKVSLGKLTVGTPFGPFLSHHLAINDVQVLDIAIDHLNALTTLPFYHRDPFDRLMVA